MAVEAPNSTIAEPTARIEGGYTGATGGRYTSTRPRRGPGTAILTAVGFLVVAGALVGVGQAQRTTATETRGRVRRVAVEVLEFEDTYVGDQQQLATMQAAGAQTQDALAALIAAFRADVEASNRAVDVVNRAADLFNNGQPAAAAELLQGDGKAMGSALEQASVAAQSALIDVQRPLNVLRGSTGG